MVKACIRQKRQAQRELYLRFSYMMKGVCLRYSQNEQEAEDLLQESFIKAFNNIKSYKNTGALGGWLRKVSLNTALEHYRKNKGGQPIIPLAVVDQNTTVNDEAIENLALEDLLYKIQQLPTGFRTVFNLYAVEGYNHREIAKLLSISEGTSKSQYSRARHILRQMIENEIKRETMNKTINYAK